MSAFNTVIALTRCTVCGNKGLFEVQFKYGDTWQYVYRIGDCIRWGGNDYGDKAAEVLRVKGLGGPCPNCAADDQDFAVVISNGEIVSVGPNELATEG